MSWDVLVLNADGAPTSLRDAGENWTPKALGDAGTIRDMVSNCLPTIHWSAPDWGRYMGDQFNIQFHLPGLQAVNAFSLYVRGTGDPLGVIVHVCKANDWIAFDYSAGEMIDLENPSSTSWKEFQDYRDRVFSTL